jgi:HD-GYP domain-containing protein (c-di-GMP phosphodiesterase class II)
MSVVMKTDAVLADCAPRAARLRRQFIKAIGLTADVYTRFACDQELDVATARQVVDQLRGNLSEDFAAAVHLAVQSLYDSYPVRHSVQSSMLSMALGLDAGFTEDEIQSIGLGSLVHDAGMMLVPSRLLGVEPMTDRDRRDLMRHPLHAAAALDSISGVPTSASSVAAQMHERLDGGGYPHGLRGSAIDRLARYAAVVDAFLGMISPRPHRPANEPYKAVEEILFAARGGRFDPAAVRSLLRVVSLYPVGSCVGLNDGRIGRVHRSNPEAVDRPVVVALDLECEPPEFEFVDLVQHPELKVVRVGEISENATSESTKPL